MCVQIVQHGHGVMAGGPARQHGSHQFWAETIEHLETLTGVDQTIR